jgi:acyl-CoA hydrolase
MDNSAVEYLAEKLLENQTYDKDGYVIIDLSVDHLEYLVQRAKQIEQLNFKSE